MSFIIPGIYSENRPVETKLNVMDSVNVVVSAIVGTAKNGTPNKAIKVNSWGKFCKEFARGFESPYLAGSYLAKCVYGYFQNGGSELYVVRAISSTAKKASTTATDSGVTFTAANEGTWGNKLSIKIAESEAGFIVTIKSTLNEQSENVEVFTNLSNTPSDDQYFVKVLNRDSRYVSVSVTGDSSALSATSDDLNLTGGSDGESITGSELTTALEVGLKGVKYHMIAHTFDGDSFNTALSNYISNLKEEVLGVANLPSATTHDTMDTALEKCKGRISVYHPWVSVTDPLSDVLADELIPNVGHVMGVSTRVIHENGIWKAPAGVKAFVKGVNSVSYYEEEELEEFYSRNINCLIEKPEYGIVVWGARTQDSDNRYKYSSSVLLDIFIKRSVKELSAFAVFEPNNELLWNKVDTAIRSFLDSLWKLGGLAGSKSSEAYKVVCDSTVNTPETIAEGKLYCNVSYAKDVPAEFIIFCFSQTLE